MSEKDMCGKATVVDSRYFLKQCLKITQKTFVMT